MAAPHAQLVSEALGHSSVIDYFMCDMVDDILDYCVGLRWTLTQICQTICPLLIGATVFALLFRASGVTKEPTAKQLRWDHGGLLSYYNTLLYPLCCELLEFSEYFADIREVNSVN